MKNSKVATQTIFPSLIIKKIIIYIHRRRSFHKQKFSKLICRFSLKYYIVENSIVHEMTVVLTMECSPLSNHTKTQA